MALTSLAQMRSAYIPIIKKVEAGRVPPPVQLPSRQIGQLPPSRTTVRYVKRDGDSGYAKRAYITL